MILFVFFLICVPKFKQFMKREETKTALIIIDLLQDFFNEKIWPDSTIPEKRKSLVANTNELVAICRDKEVPIIWFRQAFKPDLSDAFPHMRRTGKKYTIAGTPGCELLPELDVAPRDHILFKSRFSAFFRTELDQLLEKLRINHLILAGITSAWCIRSSAVDAYQRDYDVFIAKDCIAAFSEDDHHYSMRAMDGYIATLMTNTKINDQLSMTVNNER
jgi:nicotinamidase-related amidase